MTTLGWCNAAPGCRPQHNLCPHVVPSQLGVDVICHCECHQEDA